MKTLLRGRWQAPLAIVAMAIAGLALQRLVPPPREINFDSMVVDVMSLSQAGAYSAAADSAANLLAHQPPLPARQQAVLHGLLSDVLYRQELDRGTPILENVRLIIEHNQRAEELGQAPGGAALLRAAHAHEWLKAAGPAADAYRRVLSADASPDEQRTARRALVGLLQRADEVDERRAHLEALLTDEAVPAEFAAWALQRVVQEQLEAGDVDGAQAALDRHGERLRTSDLRGYLEFMQALLLVQQGRLEDATPLVDWIDEWLNANKRAENRAQECGHLPAMNRWLRGYLALVQDQPNEALQASEQALTLLGAKYGIPPSDVALFVAASETRSRALAALERHDASRAGLGGAATQLRSETLVPLPGVLRLRLVALDLFEKCYAQRDYDNALGYLTLAAAAFRSDDDEETLSADPPHANVLERVARVLQEAAEAAPEHERNRRLESGRFYERAAKLVELDEPRFANALWSSAQQYDQSGAHGDARRMLTRFIDGRSFDSRLPKALLQIGQTHEADGRLTDAITWYRRVAEKFPKLEEAARAKLLHAGCLMALGSEFSGEAEGLLRDLLRDDGLGPKAPVYRDALYSLGDLLYNSERYGEVIGQIEAFLALYPEDPERLRCRFMLADAYRRSALALRNNPPADVATEKSAEESRTRLRQAARLFDEVLSHLDEGATAGEPLFSAGGARPTQLFERLALFYRGDCLFELNEPEDLQEALATYRQVAARYESEPAALSAQVQLANVYLRLGKTTEAARALERARWLVRNIPDRAFAESDDSTSRADWEKYLSAVASSHLFRDLLARSD